MDSLQSCRLQFLRELRPLQIEISDELWPGYEDTRPEYEPRGACLDLQSLEDPEILISGPAGTGKTRSILQKVHRLAKEYPGSRYLLVRKSRTDLSESALQIFEHWVLGQDHPMVVDGPRRDNRWIYRYPNGSEVLVGGIDRPKKIMSTEYDVITVFEAIELGEEDWENLTTRLRNYVLPYQQIIGDTNPDIPTHWLKLRCETSTTLLESTHKDNPRYYDEKMKDWTAEGKSYIEGTLGNLTGVRRLRLLEGKWVKAEGLIFGDWDNDIHLIDRFPIPAHWKKFRVIDFGYVNPFVCGWFALDEDGRLYLYKYIYMTKRTVSDHAEKIKDESRRQPNLSSEIICDHDAGDQATLRANGFLTKNADKRVSIGLDKVMERLKLQEDERPRFFILRDSLIETDRSLVEEKKPYKIEQEFDGYVWNERSKKEGPVKEDDHGMDMIRYAIMEIDGRLKGWARGAAR